eukprot:TRINITY_DN58450_c0_g1_i1.p1 TRINITY_DN58450_c0_g1~~TRINITY_DN58450_c0_g1_i1.p1  ORF type:complete len:176 (+),score=22.56 TRINITY_DN58450_c0_g1_i1:22-528(+)
MADSSDASPLDAASPPKWDPWMSPQENTGMYSDWSRAINRPPSTFTARMAHDSMYVVDSSLRHKFLRQMRHEVADELSQLQPNVSIAKGSSRLSSPRRLHTAADTAGQMISPQLPWLSPRQPPGSARGMDSARGSRNHDPELMRFSHSTGDFRWGSRGLAGAWSMRAS